MKNIWKIPMPPNDPALLLQPVDNYALHPIPEAIRNWESIAFLLRADHVYDVTVFYSQRKRDLTEDQERDAYNANQSAFDAAKKTGTLVLYYQGDYITNQTAQKNAALAIPFTPNCMSFCIWNSLKEAKEGAQTTEHRNAARKLMQWYDAFAIEKFRLIRKTDREIPHLIFERVPYIK